jgi:GNAT superfamily N-acetyltransferase
VSWAIRRATPDDAALLARHRGLVCLAVYGWDEATVDAQMPVWTAFFTDMLAESRYLGWVAHDGETVLGSGALLVNAIVPRPGHAGDRYGRVHSVWVEPAARRQGIARAIMLALIDYARTAMLVRLVLHPSDVARPLYAALGFTQQDEMALPLSGT